MRRWPILFALLAWAGAAQALELDGRFMQGGLVTGRVPPGSRVQLDGEAVALAPDGAFVIGFGRDAGPAAHLEVTAPDGQVEVRELAIAAQAYDIQRIDGLPERQVTPAPEDAARIQADNEKIRLVRARVTPHADFLSGFIWPVTGPVSGVFGSQRILNGVPKAPHNGVDVAAPVGAPVVAPAPGRVALVVEDMFYTGKTVMLDHGLGLTSVYAHLNSIAVREGDALEQGDLLGAVGQTGRVTGAHLHWGLTWKGVHLDPRLAAGDMPQEQAQN